MAFKMSLFILRLYADMRVVVDKRGPEWEVWPQRQNYGTWIDSGEKCIFASKDRVIAMAVALKFSEKLICNVEGAHQNDAITEALKSFSKS